MAQGTFLVRPSLSLAGAMVLSVVVDGAVKHMALDGNQLDTRSLEVNFLPVVESSICLHCLTICNATVLHVASRVLWGGVVLYGAAKCLKDVSTPAAGMILKARACVKLSMKE